MIENLSIAERMQKLSNGETLCMDLAFYCLNQETNRIVMHPMNDSINYEWPEISYNDLCLLFDPNVIVTADTGYVLQIWVALKNIVEHPGNKMRCERHFGKCFVYHFDGKYLRDGEGDQVCIDSEDIGKLWRIEK